MRFGKPINSRKQNPSNLKKVFAGVFWISSVYAPKINAMLQIFDLVEFDSVQRPNKRRTFSSESFDSIVECLL